MNEFIYFNPYQINKNFMIFKFLCKFSDAISLYECSEKAIEAKKECPFILSIHN